MDQQTLKERLPKAMFQEALFRPESALVISLTLLLAVFAPRTNLLSFIPYWAWLLGGLIAEGALVASSLSDPDFSRRVVEKLLRRQFKPEKLHDPRLQQRIAEAFDYRARIEQAIRQQDDSLLKDDLHQTAAQMDTWLEHIYTLAQRIDRYRMEREVLERDRTRTARRIQELRQALDKEDNPQVRAQIGDTLTSKQRQLETIESLHDTIQRAELQLENSHANLGTLYSQTMLVDAKDIDSGRAQRLRQEISDEVDELHDVLLAMDEVYAAQNGL